MRATSRLAAVGAAALAATQLTAAVPAAFSAWRGVAYPAWTRAVVPLSEAGAASWTALFAVGVLCAGVAACITTKNRLRALTRLLGIVLLLIAAFEASWGLNERRPPYQVRLGLPELAGAVGGATDEAVTELARDLVRVIQRDLPEGQLDERAAHASVARALAAFAPGVRLPRGPKLLPPAVLGPWGVAGVISPWTLESHVDGGLPAWARVAVGAHETAHLAGFASEAGAELVGLLAGLRADDGAARYAAALRAWISLPDGARAAAPLPSAAQADVAALFAAAERRWKPGATAAWSVYDGYLRLRGQEGGTAGYGAGTDGLLAARAAGLW